ncbi:MAG: winged helix-turn-helix domain-containing protein [Thermoleophilia bacterium]
MSGRVPELAPDQARRIALAAQGIGEPAPAARIDRRHLRRVLARTALLQIDSVNVLERAHYLPAYSRLGPYPTAILDDMAWGRRPELFEYWGHEASLLPQPLQPLLRWRMERARRGETWGVMARLARERPDLVERVRGEVAARGPVRPADIDGHGRAGPGMWERSEVKQVLEWLFWTGEVAVARREGFARLYDLPERVLPPAVLAAPTPSEEDAHRRLLLVAARSLGVATAGDLADYFRIRVPLARPRIAELVEDGALRPVTVRGWSEPAFMHPEARLPRRVRAATLLSPFDPLVWERSRAERLFGFRYRIEIYVPRHRRVHGYYVLPFLWDDRLAARVDLKADRARGVLLALSAHAEDGHGHGPLAEALAAELRRLAGWRGLGRVEAADRGDLAPALRRALGAAQG